MKKIEAEASETTPFWVAVVLVVLGTLCSIIAGFVILFFGRWFGLRRPLPRRHRGLGK